jgi:hypothetical protein
MQKLPLYETMLLKIIQQNAKAIELLVGYTKYFYELKE